MNKTAAYMLRGIIGFIVAFVAAWLLFGIASKLLLTALPWSEYNQPWFISLAVLILGIVFMFRAAVAGFRFSVANASLPESFGHADGLKGVLKVFQTAFNSLNSDTKIVSVVSALWSIICLAYYFVPYYWEEDEFRLLLFCWLVPMVIAVGILLVVRYRRSNND